MKSQSIIRSLLALYLVLPATIMQAQTGTVKYSVYADQAGRHQFRIEAEYQGVSDSVLLLKLPQWSPGYYQRMDYASNLTMIAARDASGKTLQWEKPAANAWRIVTNGQPVIRTEYTVTANRRFVANSFVDSTHAYLLPATAFLYPEGKLSLPSEVKLNLPPDWKRVATGLDSSRSAAYTYSAPGYDILYDCPILAGPLEDLPPFLVRGVPHYFTAWQAGDFDGAGLMNDLQKIVTVATDMFNDVPYTHYHFIGIGPGMGGIEHLNSAAVSFTGRGWSSAEARSRTLFFLAHEYFHHFNVKRIRPIELGPFDYDKGSRTRQLWISEGLSVYYEYQVVRRAGLCSDSLMWDALRHNMMAFENKPGKHFQSLAEASYETWSDGPFGTSGTDANKSISYYEKGPVVGLLFDLGIRQATKNRKSLDDVMRALYDKYYKGLNRGFTEEEFRQTCESIAGRKLDELFGYVYSTAPLDYPKYFGYAGLQIDTAKTKQNGAWLGFRWRNRNDSLLLTAVDYGSPAWNSGMRPGQVLMPADGARGDFEGKLRALQTGDHLQVTAIDNGKQIALSFTLTPQFLYQFQCRLASHPSALQKAIMADVFGFHP